MKNSQVIAIFAKTPGLSAIKTRLAKDIGEEKAHQLYKLSVEAVLDTVKLVFPSKSQRYIALAEKDGLESEFWDKHKLDFNLIWTGEGGLGKRLSNIYSELLTTADQVNIIGSDSPQLNEISLRELVEYQSTKNKYCHFGPSIDGGFYFFKGDDYIAASIWDNVIYSESDTLSQLTSNLKKESFEISMGKFEIDIDNISSLNKIVEILKENSFATLTQKKIISWYASNF